MKPLLAGANSSEHPEKELFNNTNFDQLSITNTPLIHTVEGLEPTGELLLQKLSHES